MTPELVLDLGTTGYTERGSRLVAVRTPGDDGVTVDVCEAVYERPLAECRRLAALEVLHAGAASGAPPVAGTEGVRWGDVAHLVIDGGLVSLRLRAGARVRWQRPPCPAGARPCWTVSGRGAEIRDGGDAVEIGATADDVTVRWRLQGAADDLDAPSHDELAAAATERWSEWMARAPRVDPRWQEVVDRSWWQLAANIVRLDCAPGRELVVPSKLGYVAAWQWDSYFIAIGLRHGAPELAADQIRFFLDQQLPSGFIPDVVHDTGRIASVADLPDRERAWTAKMLRLPESLPELGAIPVTKPPLAAWAAELVREAGGPDLVVERGEQFDRLRDWWLARPSPDGLPGFEHPYSSGFDDSPLFDDGAPVFAPDLPSYLVVEAEVLAAAARRRGDDADAKAHERRAADLTARLVSHRWDPARRAFRVLTPADESPVRTPVDLTPLLTGRLPAEIVTALVGDLAAPGLFAAPYPLPTVAFGDPTFDAERMWRGPVWVNVNWLIVQGLRRSGRADAARGLAERTLDLARHTPGCFEYLRADTGAASPTAVAGFGWTAALLVDLAVYLSRAANAAPDDGPGVRV